MGLASDLLQVRGNLGARSKVNGYPYWRHLEHGMTLTELRRTKIGNINW